MQQLLFGLEVEQKSKNDEEVNQLKKMGEAVISGYKEFIFKEIKAKRMRREVEEMRDRLGTNFDELAKKFKPSG